MPSRKRLNALSLAAAQNLENIEGFYYGDYSERIITLIKQVSMSFEIPFRIVAAYIKFPKRGRAVSGRNQGQFFF